MTNFDYNLKNSIFNKELIKLARQEAVKRESQKESDSTKDANEIKEFIAKKSDNAGVFRELTDEEVEARIKLEEKPAMNLFKKFVADRKNGITGTVPEV